MIAKAGISDPNDGFLKEQAQAWVPQHIEIKRKALRRRYFMGDR
jgi:hypothetical protein